MIREDLLEFQYYLDRLSMFMKESYGITEQTEIFYRQLYEVNQQLDFAFTNLDIWNNQNIKSEFLDLIGAIFGLRRSFNIEYTYINDQQEEINVKKNISLNDNDFLIYIKCQIIKQNFQGTNEELERLYTHYKNNKQEAGLIDLCFIYILTIGSANCSIYFQNSSSFSENIIELFKAGYLTIESMGIKYTKDVGSIFTLGRFGYASSTSDQYKFYTDSTNKGGRFA